MKKENKFRIVISTLLEKKKSYENMIEFYNKHSLEHFWNTEIQELTKQLTKHCTDSIEEINDAIVILETNP